MPEITTIILTGGAATRMRPLSLDKTKSMIPFMGKPLISHLIEPLRDAGLTDLVFTSTGKNGEIEEYFSDGRALGVSIEYFEDKKWYGTAGSIKRTVDKLKDRVSEPFMIIYGDSLLKADFGKMVDFHFQHDSWCTILYHSPRFDAFPYEFHDGVFEKGAPRTNYGIMEVVGGSRITKVEEKPCISDIEEPAFSNPMANAAVYIMRKQALDKVPPNGRYDFPADLFPLLIEDRIPCFGFDIGEGYRVDIGTISNYYSAHMAILEGKVDFCVRFPRIRDRAWVGSDSKIDSPGNLRDPILICEKCKVGPNTDIECSVIGSNAHIGEGCFIERSIILDNVRIGNGVRISDSIIGENSLVEDNICVPPNTVLGNFCHLGGDQLAQSEADFMGLVRR